MLWRACLMVAIASLCAGAVETPKPYNIIELGTLGGTQTFAGDINNAGQIVGALFDPQTQTSRAVLHHRGTVTDLGAMARRAGATHLMLTHLIPPLGAARHGPWKVPGGALGEDDYRKAAQEGGFSGSVVVGADLSSVRVPAK